MKLTGQQKVYLGALALAAGAFAVDRLFFTPPMASARPPTSSTVAAPAGKRTQTPANQEQADALTDLSNITRRLNDAATLNHLETSKTKDAFQPSAAWIEQANARNRRSLPSAADQFRKQHHLTAVMTGGQAAWAIVDGKTLAVGQEVGGFHLVKVGERWAVFDSADARVELQLQK